MQNKEEKIILYIILVIIVAVALFFDIFKFENTHNKNFFLVENLIYLSAKCCHLDHKFQQNLNNQIHQLQL